jgi:hypothetical protein
MKFRISLLVLMILSVTLVYEVSGQTPIAVKGVIDLRNIPNKNKFIVRLNGEWGFYWKKMLHPNTFTGLRAPEPDLYGKIPSYWTAYSSAGFKTAKYGYATYTLIILLPHDINRRLAFDVPVFDSSFDLWVNDTLLASNGQPGLSAEEEKPEYRPGFHRYIATSDTVKLIINVSNFHHRRGGFWVPMKFGTFPEINKTRANLGR